MSSEATVTKVEPEEAIVFLSDVRAQLKDSFGINANTEDDQLNIDHNIMKIRALLTINREIFFRCTKYGEKSTLQRFGFETIKTRQVDAKLEFFTQAERVEQTFDTSPLSRPPSGFDDIIVVKYTPDTKFIDFIDFFRKTLLLNDDTLEFLLPKLKEHLEAIQVCLGVLEEWLMQPMKNVSFINSVFEKSCTIPSKEFHSRRSQCCFCGSPFVPAALFATAANGTPTSTFTFGVTAPAVFDKLAVASTCTYNKCKQVHVLAECSVSGMHRESFDISQESEREKLQRFLYFVKGA